MTSPSVTLKMFVHQRHWKYSTFCAEYDRVAAELDPRLVGSSPSRAQYQRWLTGHLKGLPYPDACRILEGMFPGWSAEDLFRGSPTDLPPAGAALRLELDSGPVPAVLPAPVRPGVTAAERMWLITSGGELRTALVEVVRSARECLVAVGSRSCEPAYLHEIEPALQNRPALVHHRVLMGMPHNELLKHHLVRLLDVAGPAIEGRARVHISLVTDLVRDQEKCFVASESCVLVVLPSANSPRNFDTGLLVDDPNYADALVQHGRALCGPQRLESVQAIEALQVCR
jgi:hypothetical protein